MLSEFNKCIEAYGTDSILVLAKGFYRSYIHWKFSSTKSGLPSVLPEFNKCIEAYGTDSELVLAKGSYRS